MCMNRFKWMLAYIALALTALTGPLLAQSIDEVSISRGYPLAAGDVLRIDFLVRPEIGRDVPVELNGYASFPFIDPVLVSGRTIAELRAELPVLMSGAVIRERVGDEYQMVPVTDYGVTVSVKSYRPVIVSGAVNQPGDVAFSVGMTARLAVAKALGLSMNAFHSVGATSLGGSSPDLAALIIERAVLKALINGKTVIEADDIVIPLTTSLSPEDLRSRANEDLTLRLAILSEQEAQQKSKLAAAEQDVMAALARKEDMMRATEIEQSNVTRLEGLAARSMVSYGGTLIQGRRALMQASNLVHSTDEDIENALMLHSTILSDTKIERLKREREWRARIAQIDASLGIQTNSGSLLGASDTSLEPTITLYRQTTAGSVSRRIDLDTLLLPGDVIDVQYLRLSQ
ncbi:polysaccharide biosynthesis/export family protein [Celeribacter halophilus]|uniref:polysaccharide biosynthesis/export family protein n=1 Tax=Celeribacter halophilus TaxID=576117 RepID=UPI003A959B47